MVVVLWTAFFCLLYVSGLFALAHVTESIRRKRSVSIADNPWVYTLSIAVYCTTWTFYGSVGRAATRGVDFLAIYIGPTLIFLMAPTLLSKLISYCRENGVTNIPDLLDVLFGSAKKGHGQALGRIAALMLVLGVTPYIGLQLKAIAHTFELITGWQSGATITGDVGFWAAAFLSAFAMLFGARSLSPTERHEGLVVAVAFESAVKLIVFLVLGVYITWGVGGGLTQVVTEALADPRTASLFVLGGPGGSSVSEWLTLCTLSASAVVLLPRQFHVIVVENQTESHVKRAAWGFPLYLILINLLVIPVALVGVLGGVGGGADYFLLNIPLQQGNRTMAFIAFLGGFSAATSMVIVSSVAVSTVINNHLIVPSVFKRFGEKELSGPLLGTKRAAIAFVIFLGYASYRWIGDSHTLVSTGLLSFSAVFQFAPAVGLGGYWSGMRRRGAITGLSAGFVVWGYTLMLPSFARSGWLGTGILENGPWGLSWLRPEALLGLEGLDPWSHALVWSLVFNLGGCILVSLMGSDPVEKPTEPPLTREWVGREEVERLLTRFIGADKAAEVMETLPPNAEARQMVDLAERALSGAVGAVNARALVQSYLSWTKGRSVEILDIFGSVSRTLAESRENLERRVRELSVLHKATRTLSTTMDVDAFLNLILRLIKSEFGLSHLGVRLLDARGRLAVRSSIGLDEEYADATRLIPSRDTLFGRAFLDGKPVVVGDVKDAPTSSHFEMLRKLIPVGAFIHAPMIHERKPIGVLMAYATHGPVHFTDEFVSLFCALANQMAMAVVNAELYQEVRAYSQSMEEKVRKRTAQLEAANDRLREIDRLKSEFLSTVSHELRTPLTSIQSFSEILLRYDVDDEVRRKKFAGIIHDEAQRLTRMINELLDLSKIEAGELEVNLEPVDVADSLGRAIEATAPLVVDKAVEVLTEVEPGLPPVLCNTDRFQQILTNLLGNAAKFAPEKSRITISVRRRGGFALFAVVDEGEGIERSMLRQIFDRYKQLREPGKKQALGTGLGLAISRDLVERFGGYIWVESSPGEGASFYFTMPLVRSPEPPEDSSSDTGA